MPLRNRASTSARRYRGLPVSLRTSGSCPRRAHDATDAEVTRNRTATCLRVIRSSSTQLPVMAAAAKSEGSRTRHKCRPAELVSAPLRSSGSLVDRNQLIRRQRRPLCAVPGKARGKVPNCPVPLALEMVLQVAAQDIGQLTDIERPRRRVGYGRRLCPPWSPRDGGYAGWQRFGRQVRWSPFWPGRGTYQCRPGQNGFAQWCAARHARRRTRLLA